MRPWQKSLIEDYLCDENHVCLSSFLSATPMIRSLLAIVTFVVAIDFCTHPAEVRITTILPRLFKLL